MFKGVSRTSGDSGTEMAKYPPKGPRSIVHSFKCRCIMSQLTNAFWFHKILVHKYFDYSSDRVTNVEL